MYKLFIDCMQSTFLNVEIILKNLLTLPIRTATGERSISALKRIKKYLKKNQTLKFVRKVNVQAKRGHFQ